jgi:DNA-binding FadR family transcriptional regulator
MSAEPISELRRSPKVSEIVARQIVKDIARRKLEPGTMLPSEAVMLETYGVGRASLREALRILEIQGLVVLRPGPGGGPMVAAIDSRHFGRMATFYLHLVDARFRDVVEARLVMEPVMARLAAERQDKVCLAELRAFVDGPAPTEGDDVEYLERAGEFHSMVSTMSGNPVLDLFGGALKDIYSERIQGQVFATEDRERVHHDHVAVAEAILAGDAERAEELMKEHMLELLAMSMERNQGMRDEVVDWR